MSRSILDESSIHPAIRDRIANLNADSVLVGGATDLKALIASGELGRMLGQ